MVDCSECKNCYMHPVAWGEYWCRIKEAKTGDGWVYESHSLKKRFKDNCEDFEESEGLKMSKKYKKEVKEFYFDKTPNWLEELEKLESEGWRVICGEPIEKFFVKIIGRRFILEKEI